MSEDPSWLPALILLNEFDGDWSNYVNAIYERFEHDLLTNQPKYAGKWVRCRRDPIYDGKYAGFWHCVSEGNDETNRTPDLRRCERIGWVRAVIVNADSAREIYSWKNDRQGEIRNLLWFREEYLVVLAERTRKHDGFQYFQLITAYQTPEESRKRKLRAERDSAGP